MGDKSDQDSARYLWLVVLVLALIGGAIMLVTAPVGKLLGDGVSPLRGALHGTIAGLFMITATVGLFQGYRLFTGHPRNIADFQVGSVANATLALFTIVLGNWAYIPYRALGGPRTWFLENNPVIHKIFFEFKEFTALFTFPLAVAAAYILIHYGSEVLRRKDLSSIVAVLLALVFSYFLIAFGLGAAVTKLKSI